jgi:D-alanyl-D-alanine carboxypeptidase/D-alanyl-D-alanine-endopeptidase (penicillin-binding protein 4)
MPGRRTPPDKNYKLYGQYGGKAKYEAAEKARNDAKAAAKKAAEALGKIATIESGFDANYDNLDTAYERILEGSGLDFSGVSVRDGSGLSALNLVSPRFMAELMRLVDSGYGDFDVIKNSLMVAGETGSLATRFQGDLSDAAGNVRAKTGYLTKVHTLNGIIEAKDGTSLTFTIYAYGAVGNDVRVAIDTLVTSFYRCGNTLSND